MTDFKQLLFRAGFMNFGKLDRKATMAFLLLKSERTLERWISTNNPCPRAVAMLESRINGGFTYHKSWDGFYICRDGYLWTPRGKRYDASVINKIDFMQRAVRYSESETESLKQQIAYLHDLVEASETLKAIGSDLIKMGDQLAIKDVVLKYGDKKTA
ncbi:DUF3653 domain-containing protein [Pseudoalteromonas sp. MEBiC 03485]|uniref:DUF3653 domain-containing protein n=1 Tax=Pseudoalteromonas sp. MEBiC 03485 TaxID=2571103 RepID=UPI00101F1786|nr:DUF3653 domain-containing protein [Pseudoalteromonas sp. MEBiC 03485]RZD19850.1 hypothetical protein EVU92_17165 [Pseudoalteromonas sp. MEBiC 03485]